MSRSKYATYNPLPLPIMQQVLVHGFIAHPRNDSGVVTGPHVEHWIGARRSAGTREYGYTNITPEQITASVWNCIACGVDGLCYSDFHYNGEAFGLMMEFTGRHDLEYGSITTDHPAFQDTNWLLPQMWLGFKSRYEAVRRVNVELKDHILPVYETLEHAPWSLNASVVSDTQYRSMPLLALLKTRLARRDTATSGVRYQDSGVYDAPSKTYVNASVFRPRYEDSTHVRYLCVVNLRTWPEDFQHYSDSIRTELDTTHTNLSHGLGVISARQPVVYLKPTAGVLADSFVVEKVGDSTWRRTVAIGQPLDLDWLPPAWGAMYRVTPIPAHVSQYGTSFNNAVHSEYSRSKRERLIVYERDGAVYLRTINDWSSASPEMLVSPALDTTEDYRRYNMTPAIATCRDGHSAVIVWETRDSSAVPTGSVEGIYLATIPDTTITSDTIRFRLGSPRTLAQNPPWRGLTPAIVGINGGYLIAFPNPAAGIDLVAMKDSPSHPIDSSDTAMYRRIYAKQSEMGFSHDSVTTFPTLAYVPNITPVEGLTTDYIDTFHGPDGSAPEWFQTTTVAHLAYEQGHASGSNTTIMYNRIAVLINAGNQPRLWVTGAEHVAAGMSPCGFHHPSIAVDNARLGVAFESHGIPPRSVLLRFRDTTKFIAPSPAWNTTTYQWRDKVLSRYAWPSLMQFPGLSRDTLTKVAQGALAWMSTPGGSPHSQQFIYRYGQATAQPIADGQYPTMTLVPYDTAQFFGKSSVLYRGDTTTRDNLMHYPPALVNAPWQLEPLFYRSGSFGSVVVAATYIPSRFDQFSSCNEAARLGFDPAASGIRIDPDGMPVPDDAMPGLPPSFFELAQSGSTLVLSPDDAADVTRTSVFTPDGRAIGLRRVMTGSEELVGWLDTQPEDSITNEPANIFSAFELVRNSDGIVLWRSDTIDMRSIGSGEQYEDVPIPADSLALSVPVYVRLRTFTTNGLSYHLSAGFTFTDDTTGGAFARPVFRMPPVRQGASAGTLRLSMIPDPVRSSGVLRVETERAGTVHASITDQVGSVLRRLTIECERAGVVVKEIDLNGLASGRYLVRARSGAAKGEVSFAVVR